VGVRFERIAFSSQLTLLWPWLLAAHHEPSCTLAPLPFLLVSLEPTAAAAIQSVSSVSQQGQDELEGEGKQSAGATQGGLSPAGARCAVRLASRRSSLPLLSAAGRCCPCHCGLRPASFPVSCSSPIHSSATSTFVRCPLGARPFPPPHALSDSCLLCSFPSPSALTAGAGTGSAGRVRDAKADHAGTARATWPWS
jgi:hypothetical protein